MSFGLKLGKFGISLSSRGRRGWRGRAGRTCCAVGLGRRGAGRLFWSDSSAFARRPAARSIIPPRSWPRR